MAGQSYTREQWARALLAAVGNRNPSQQAVDFVVAWTGGETYGPGGSGANNLLNTTQGGFGNTGRFAGTNVKNYPTFTQGIAANAYVLRSGQYSALLHALQTNDINALLNDPTVRYEIQHIWGTSTWNPANALRQFGLGGQSFPEGTPAPGDIPVAPQHAKGHGAVAPQNLEPHSSPHTDPYGQPYAMNIPRQTTPLAPHLSKGPVASKKPSLFKRLVRGPF